MSIIDNPKYSYLIGKQNLFFRVWKKLFYYYCSFVFIFYTPVKVKGRKNLPTSSAIYCSNHNSHMDVALISYAVKKSFNHFGMLAAIDYWFDSLVKKTLTNIVMNLIPVSRRYEKKENSISFEDTVTLCEKFMEHDQRNIVIFPEGSRGTSDKILPFLKGAARFSQALKKPIVPIYISGSSKSWPKGKIFMKPCRITINILEPIEPSDYISNIKDDFSISDTITSLLEKRITDERNRNTI